MDALSILLAALSTFSRLEAITTSEHTTSKSFATTVTSVTYITAIGPTPRQIPPTITRYTNGEGKLFTPYSSTVPWNTTLYNTTSGIEVTSAFTTSTAQPSLYTSDDLGSVATEVLVVTLTEYRSTPTVTVTDSTPSEAFFYSTSSSDGWLSATMSADETTYEAKMYSGNPSTTINTISNAVSNTTSTVEATITGITQSTYTESNDPGVNATNVSIATLTQEGAPPPLTANDSTWSITLKHKDPSLTWSNTFFNTTVTQPVPTKSADIGFNFTNIPIATLTKNGSTSTLVVINEMTITETDTITYTERMTTAETDHILTTDPTPAISVETTTQLSTITAADIPISTTSTSAGPSICSDTPDNGNSDDGQPEKPETPETCGIHSTDTANTATGPESSGTTVSTTISMAASGTDFTSSATGSGDTESVVGMTTLTTTAFVTSAVSTVTVTNTNLVIPMQGSSSQSTMVTGSVTSSIDDATTIEATSSPVESLSIDPIVSIQTTVPTESIEPVITAKVSSDPSAVTAPDGIHIPHGHPPLVTSEPERVNWNSSTSSTKFSTPELTGTVPTSSSFITATTSRVFVGYPPALSEYNNGSNADTSTSSTELSTEVEPATTTSATLGQSPTHAELATTSAATLPGVPPAPIVPLDSCSPGMWGRPGCLSTPASFFDQTSSVAGRVIQNSTVASASSVPPGYGPPIPADPSNSTTGLTITVTSSTLSHTETHSSTSSNSSSAQPAGTQCTTTFYSLPTNACTKTKYVSTKWLDVACFGCVGAHAAATSTLGKTNVSRRQKLPVFAQTYTNTIPGGVPELSDGDRILEHDN